jgi:hypothetical protein
MLYSYMYAAHTHHHTKPIRSTTLPICQISRRKGQCNTGPIFSLRNRQQNTLPHLTPPSLLGGEPQRMPAQQPIAMSELCVPSSLDPHAKCVFDLCCLHVGVHMSVCCSQMCLEFFVNTLCTCSSVAPFYFSLNTPGVPHSDTRALAPRFLVSVDVVQHQNRMTAHVSSAESPCCAQLANSTFTGDWPTKKFLAFSIPQGSSSKACLTALIKLLCTS